MAEVTLRAPIQTEQSTASSRSSQPQGTLKTESENFNVFAFEDTGSVSKEVSEYLQEINQQPLPEGSEHEFVQITPEQVEMQEEIAALIEELAAQEMPDAKSDLKSVKLPTLPKQSEKGDLSSKDSNLAAPSKPHSSLNQTGRSSSPDSVVYSSLFTLARTFNKALSQGRPEKHSTENPQTNDLKETLPRPTATAKIQETSIQENIDIEQQERGKDKEDRQKDQEQDHRDEKEDQEERNSQKESAFLIEKVQLRGMSAHKNFESNPVKKVTFETPKASRSSSKSSFSKPSAARIPPFHAENAAAQGAVGSVESIFFRFMSLMARILGQAEAEAHNLYLRVKERTDGIDHLTLLISKINSEKGAIDWSKNDEMKQIVEKARALGVDIPEGKLKWTEDEKKLFKENIQMRKDSMEKLTQLERTDMQRFLQEASQCHQARSNILKLLKEVIDTILANMRP